MAVDIGELGGRVFLEDEVTPSLESLASSTEEGLEAFRGMSDGVDELIDRLDTLSTDIDNLEASVSGAASAQSDLSTAMGEAASGAKDLAEEEKVVEVNLMDVIAGFGRFGAVAGTALGVVTAGFTAFLGIVGAATAAVVALGQRGSDVSDIRDAFNRLTQEAGLTKDVLNTLRTATDGVITDFDLMQRTNQALGAGLRLTNEQFAVVGEGARRLADDTGRDAKEAFDSLLRAMETGQVRGLRGWQIDVVALQDKIRGAGQGLSQYEKQQIAVNSILDELRGKTERAGEVTLDFGDQIKASTNFLLNLKDEVAVIVANLPAFAIILDAIRKGLEAALGRDQAERAETLRKVFNTFAEALARGTVIVAVFAEQAVGSFKTVMNAVFELGNAFLSAQIKLTEAANFVAIGDPFAEQLKHLRETQTELQGWQSSVIGGAQATQDGLHAIALGAARAAVDIRNSINQPTKDLEDSTRRIVPVVRNHAESERDRAKALKEAEAAMKAAVAASDANRAALEALGVVTSTTVSEAMNKWNRIVNQAVKEGVPLEVVIRALQPEMLQLAAAAKLSGVNIDLLEQMMSDLEEQAKELDNTATLVSGQLQNMAPLAAGVTEEMGDQVQAVQDLNAAYQFFGIRTPQELQRASDAATRNFEVLRNSGTATTQQLREAYDKMIEAQMAASGKLPSFWETDIVPAMRSSFDTLQTSITGTFSQMLLGVESFAEGWKEIWNSIKQTALNIFNQIAEAFIGDMLKRMISGLTGSGFGNAFSGLFGGAGKGFMGLFGGAGNLAGGLPIPGTFTTTLPGLPGAGGAAAGAGGIGSLLSGLLGGAGAGAGGALLGQLGRHLFGEGLGAAAFGGATGAAQGALIGSIVPGIGTLVGALIGGLSGTISSFFGGPSKAEKEGRQQVAGFEEFLHGSLGKLQLIESGGIDANKTIIAIRDAYIAMGRSEQEALDDAARLWASSRDGGEETASVIQDIIRKMEEMAAESTDAAADMADETADAMTGAAEAVDEVFSRVREGTDEAAEEVARFIQHEDDIKHFSEQVRDVADEMGFAVEETEQLTRAINAIPRNVDVNVEVHEPEMPEPPTGSEPPESAATATAGASLDPSATLASSALPEGPPQPQVLEVHKYFGAAVLPAGTTPEEAAQYVWSNFGRDLGNDRSGINLIMTQFVRDVGEAYSGNRG